jgi:predicted Zn-dependent peptidase
MAFHTCNRNDPDRFTLKVLNVILGENMSSRLFQQVREKRGFCYEINSSVHLLEDTGIWQLYAGLDTKKVPRALDVIWRELRRLTEKPPSENEVRQAREYSIARSRISLESTTQQMMWTGESVLAFQEIIEPATAWNHLSKVTPEKVRKLAAKIFRKRRLSLALISPKFTEKEILSTIDLPEPPSYLPAHRMAWPPDAPAFPVRKSSPLARHSHPGSPLPSLPSRRKYHCPSV